MIQPLVDQYSNLHSEALILQSLMDELKSFKPHSVLPLQSFDRFIEALKVTDFCSQFGYTLLTEDMSNEEVRAALIDECEAIIQKIEAHRALLMSAIRAATF